MEGKLTIGVLALQGAFLEHEKMLEKLGCRVLEIRQRKDLREPPDGIVLPGGESTVMGRLLGELDMMKPLRGMIEQGTPVFGTCAGLILLARSLINDDRAYLGTLPVTVRRNAWGRQLGSFFTTGDMKNVGRIPMPFIRAPYIEAAGKGVEILAGCKDRITAVRFQNQLATAFHPEVTDDASVHRYFLDIVREHACGRRKKSIAKEVTLCYDDKVERGG